MADTLESVVADVSSHRQEVISKLVAYSARDMLLFWGEDKDLILRQTKIWQPILDWASEKIKADVQTTKSMELPKQSEKSGSKMRVFLESLSDKELACFYIVSSKLSSFLLATAFIRKAFDVETIMHAAFLEEEFQEEVWGAKDDVRANFDAVKKELEEINLFLRK